MEFKRGEVLSVRYNRSSCIGRHIAQEMCIKSGNQYYDVCWAILKNTDLFGEGDKVSFLVDGNQVLNLRLNPFNSDK